MIYLKLTRTLPSYLIMSSCYEGDLSRYITGRTV
jgi:hypothetical protein